MTTVVWRYPMQNPAVVTPFKAGFVRNSCLANDGFHRLTKSLCWEDMLKVCKWGEDHGAEKLKGAETWAKSWAGRGLPLRQGPRRPRQTIYNCSLSIRDNHRFSMATTTKTTTTTTIIIITIIIIIMIMIKMIVPPVCTLWTSTHCTVAWISSDYFESLLLPH